MKYVRTASRFIAFGRAPRTAQSIDKIVVVRLGGLGDLVTSTPALLRLRREWALKKLHLVVSQAGYEWSMSLIRMGLVDCVSVAEDRLYGGTSDKSLRVETILKGILLQSHQKVAVYLVTPTIKCTLVAALYAPKVATRSTSKEAGGVHESSIVRATLRVPAGVHDDVDLWNPKDHCVIHLNSRPERSWSMTNWKTISLWILSRGLTITLVGTDAEKDITNCYLRSVSEYKQHIRNLVGETDMPTLVRVLCTARGVFGTDSGVLHLAAFHGVPTYALFAWSSAEQFQPIGRRVCVIEAPDKKWDSIRPEDVWAAFTDRS